jgi:hypothetical protein
LCSFGIKINNLECYYSYDINTSSLSKASSGLGGSEVSIIYNWNKKSNPKVKTKEIIQWKECPKYL